MTSRQDGGEDNHGAAGGDGGREYCCVSTLHSEFIGNKI